MNRFLKKHYYLTMIKKLEGVLEDLGKARSPEEQFEITMTQAQIATYKRKAGVGCVKNPREKTGIDTIRYQGKSLSL